MDDCTVPGVIRRYVCVHTLRHSNCVVQSCSDRASNSVRPAVDASTDSDYVIPDPCKDGTEHGHELVACNVRVANEAANMSRPFPLHTCFSHLIPSLIPTSTAILPLFCLHCSTTAHHKLMETAAVTSGNIPQTATLHASTKIHSPPCHDKRCTYYTSAPLHHHAHL